MYRWNEDKIKNRFFDIKKLIWASNNIDEAIYLINNLSIYDKLNKILNNTFEKEDNVKYDTSAFIDNTKNNMDLNDDTYHSYAIESISNFLKQFNQKYYEFFSELIEKNSFHLIRNEKENYSTHFIDDLKKEYFIYVNSNNIENEKIMLIREFGYAYQVHIDENKHCHSYKVLNSDKKFGEDAILLIDAFPTFLELSMLDFYYRKSNEEITSTITNFIENKLLLNKEIASDENFLYSKEEKEQIPKQITSNYCALFMFSNNLIDVSFKRVDDFLENNHGTKGSILWNIANNNDEGIDQYKEHILKERALRP